MDTELLVDSRVESGRELLAQLARDGFHVAVAFWVRTSEEGLWFLYVGSASVDPAKIGDAYRAVNASLHKLIDPGISLSDIKIVHPSNPVARAAAALRDRYPARVPTRFHAISLGGLAVDEAYIYPAPGAMTSKEILRTVADLMNRTGAIQPSVVTLTNGTVIRAIPVGLNMQTHGGVRLVLHEVDTGRNQELPVEEVATIA